ncbi:MAG: carbohydrate ABC transporter permease [Chloroflexota bacterium]
MTRMQFDSSALLGKRLRPFLKTAIFSLFASLILGIYILPLSYMFITAFKDLAVSRDPYAPILWPAKTATYEFEGESYPIYEVPLDDGLQPLALVKKGREQSQFVDPNNPEAGLITWNGRWRTIDADYQFAPKWENFVTAWGRGNIIRALRNTSILMLFGLVGTVGSSVAVAYGFSRFHIPGDKLIFAVLIGTLFIPRELLSIPLYQFYQDLGWLSTLLPLIVPQFFANALYIFLLRQYFRTLPIELDEAAMIDGANPLRILWSVIIPQSIPIIATVALLQFFFIWKDFYQPLLYLTGNRELLPIALSIYQITPNLGPDVTVVMAGALLILIIPALVFLFTHRYILQAASVLGVRK